MHLMKSVLEAHQIGLESIVEIRHKFPQDMRRAGLNTNAYKKALELDYVRRRGRLRRAGKELEAREEDEEDDKV
jgi:hypothetical protein